MKVIKTRTSIEEVTEFPETIYKYRKWEGHHKTILTDQIVFMASPSSFEDPLDCKLFKRYDLLTDKEIYEKYLLHSKQHNHGYTRQQHMVFANGWAQNSPMKSAAHIDVARKEHFRQFNNRFGVLSLTANPINVEMWGKYSDNHAGFCVGFHPKLMFKFMGGGGDVKYYETLPDIMPMDTFDDEHFKQVFSKEKKWEFEQEYRTHKFYEQHLATEEDRRIKLPTNCFKEVIFGHDMALDQRKEIIEVCRGQRLPVNFFSATLNLKYMTAKMEQILNP